jgi:hypothetical protein
MSTENMPQNAYAAVLADLRAKRAEIDNTIRILEGMAGLNRADGSDTAQPVSMEGGPAEQGDDEAGAYLGMSITDAAKKLLGKRKRAMANPEIARELMAGGLALTSADPVNTVGSVLTRRFNQVGDVVRVARGTWGLKEWYPNRTFKPAAKASETAQAAASEQPSIYNVQTNDLGGDAAHEDDDIFQ